MRSRVPKRMESTTNKKRGERAREQANARFFHRERDLHESKQHSERASRPAGQRTNAQQNAWARASVACVHREARAQCQLALGACAGALARKAKRSDQYLSRR